MAINTYRQMPVSAGILKICLISQMATKAKTSFTRNSLVQTVCSVLISKFFIFIFSLVLLQFALCSI